MLVGGHLELPAHRLEELSGREQEARAARPSETLVALREGLVDQRAAGGDRRHDHGQQRPMEVIRHDHPGEAALAERPGLVALQIGADQLAALERLRVGDVGEIDIDSRHPAPAVEEQPQVATAAAGEVQHLSTGRNQAGEADHPGRRGEDRGCRFVRPGGPGFARR